MGWDSNPRGICIPAGFQDRCLKPLGHPSIADESDTKNSLAANNGRTLGYWSQFGPNLEAIMTAALPSRSYVALSTLFGKAPLMAAARGNDMNRYSGVK